MLKVFGKIILNGVFEQIHLLTKSIYNTKIPDTQFAVFQIPNTKSISNTYLKYKYFKYCPPLCKKACDELSHTSTINW